MTPTQHDPLLLRHKNPILFSICWYNLWSTALCVIPAKYLHLQINSMFLTDLYNREGSTDWQPRKTLEVPSRNYFGEDLPYLERKAEITEEQDTAAGGILYVQIGLRLNWDPDPVYPDWNIPCQTLNWDIDPDRTKDIELKVRSGLRLWHISKFKLRPWPRVALPNLKWNQSDWDSPTAAWRGWGETEPHSKFQSSWPLRIHWSLYQNVLIRWWTLLAMGMPSTTRKNTFHQSLDFDNRGVKGHG